MITTTTTEAMETVRSLLSSQPSLLNQMPYIFEQYGFTLLSTESLNSEREQRETELVAQRRRLQDHRRMIDEALHQAEQAKEDLRSLKAKATFVADITTAGDYDVGYGQVELKAAIEDYDGALDALVKAAQGGKGAMSLLPPFDDPRPSLPRDKESKMRVVNRQAAKHLLTYLLARKLWDTTDGGRRNIAAAAAAGSGRVVASGGGSGSGSGRGSGRGSGIEAISSIYMIDPDPCACLLPPPVQTLIDLYGGGNSRQPDGKVLIKCFELHRYRCRAMRAAYKVACGQQLLPLDEQQRGALARCASALQSFLLTVSESVQAIGPATVDDAITVFEKCWAEASMSSCCGVQPETEEGSRLWSLAHTVIKEAVHVALMTGAVHPGLVMVVDGFHQHDQQQVNDAESVPLQQQPAGSRHSIGGFYALADSGSSTAAGSMTPLFCTKPGAMYAFERFDFIKRGHEPAVLLAEDVCWLGTDEQSDTGGYHRYRQ